MLPRCEECTPCWVPYLTVQGLENFRWSQVQGTFLRYLFKKKPNLTNHILSSLKVWQLITQAWKGHIKNKPCKCKWCSQQKAPLQAHVNVVFLCHVTSNCFMRFLYLQVSPALASVVCVWRWCGLFGPPTLAGKPAQWATWEQSDVMAHFARVHSQTAMCEKEDYEQQLCWC